MQCKEKGTILNLVGTQKDTSKKAVELAEQYDWMYASIATHPIHLHATHVDEEESSFQSREEDFDEEFYEELVQSKKVIAVGECGLDLYHIPKGIPQNEVLEKQKNVFLKHLQFAQKHDLPMVIHCRDAHDQMIDLLKSNVSGQPSSRAHLVSSSMSRQVEGMSDVRGTIHCFTSHWDHAQQYLDMGFYLGFTGVVTFPAKKTNPKPQEWLQEVVERIPLDRIVVETDSPYLAPQAYRGQRSEPWMVEEVVKYFAQVRKMSFEDMSKQIEQNTRSLFLGMR